MTVYVPVTVYLKSSTYRELAMHARVRGIPDAEVGPLLERLAVASLIPREQRPAPKPRRIPGTLYTEDVLARAAALRAEGRSWREIAAELGGTHSGIRRALVRVEQAEAVQP
ncbi:hypothetical protein [Microbacterium sp. KNMS]